MTTPKKTLPNARLTHDGFHVNKRDHQSIGVPKSKYMYNVLEADF